MRMVPSFKPEPERHLENSYLVTFCDSDEGTGQRLLRNKLGIHDFIHANDWEDRAVKLADGQDHDTATVFDDLQICRICCETNVAERLRKWLPQSSILSVEQDHQVFMMGDSGVVPSGSPPYLDSSNETWGRVVTGVDRCRYLGTGIRIAVLDTGMDAEHPDLVHADVRQTQSFVSEQAPSDGNGHGTHCAGIILGRNAPADAPTYGIAPRCEVLVGKVLDRKGVGQASHILAGLNWAVANHCHIVSMSLGSENRLPATALEEASRRALDSGTLLIAAAGNNAARSEKEFGFVVRPANCRNVLAVGAVDRHLQIAEFSARASIVSGGEVNIVAPGVEVFSSWPQRDTHRALTGTSMATPFVTGIAALYAEAMETRGRAVWKALVENALLLSLPTVDVGAGLVYAPT